MIRTLFVGDLTNDPTRRDRAMDLLEGCSLFGIEPLDATVKLLARVSASGGHAGPSAWRLAETANRVEQWLGSHPQLIVGFDPLQAAVAMHFFPGTSVLLHIDGMGSGLPKLSLNGASRLPGLHEVLTGTLRGAARVLVSNPRNASTLERQWGVDPQRIHPSALDMGVACPFYLEATRRGLTQTPEQFHWWIDLWPTRTRGALRHA